MNYFTAKNGDSYKFGSKVVGMFDEYRNITYTGIFRGFDNATGRELPVIVGKDGTRYVCDEILGKAV